MSVYFIACGGFIKVGYSTDAEKRTRNLFRSTSRYSAPRAAYLARGTQVLLRQIEGDMGTEFAIHQALDEYAVGCEWFLDESALRDWIAAAEDDDRKARREYPTLTRHGGPAYEAIPRAERGGCNAELAYEVMAKQRARRSA